MFNTKLSISKGVSDTYVAAQLHVFFAAGFETSSTTMSNALYELAQYQSIQDEVREEIKKVLNVTDGAITYESIKEMIYLDKVFKGMCVYMCFRASRDNNF